MITPSKPSPGPWSWGEYDDQDLINDDKLCQHNGSPMGFYDESGLRGDPTHEANRALIAKSPEMAAMLRELQFCGQWRDRQTHCPICDGNPHTPDCRLAALLKELP